ncbi:hypothetical protein TRICI_005983 [Trichomonascus ciferrii]|uniref:Uncharacterized protein n=1 Tax=Trichomonascus ciferrii TaxID=44093 RepID=A0A642US69_9ASCO|nr:hypothetical protein TRICI_005983 [Trichomonascus ciferrii]
MVLDLLLKGLETAGVDVVSVGLGDEIGVGPGESGDHCWVGGSVEEAANDVTEEDLSSVGDRLDEGAQESSANGKGESSSEWSQGVGNGIDGVVNLRVNTLNESGDSSRIGVFRMFTDLSIHLVNLLLTVQDGAVDTHRSNTQIDVDGPRG